MITTRDHLSMSITCIQTTLALYKNHEYPYHLSTGPCESRPPLYNVITSLMGQACRLCSMTVHTVAACTQLSHPQTFSCTWLAWRSYLVQSLAQSELTCVLQGRVTTLINYWQLVWMPSFCRSLITRRPLSRAWVSLGTRLHSLFTQFEQVWTL